MKLIAFLLLLAPLPALALDQGDAAKGGGGAAAVAVAALVARRKQLHARHAKTVDTEAARWGWDEQRQAHELRALKARHTVKGKLRNRRRR